MNVCNSALEPYAGRWKIFKEEVTEHRLQFFANFVENVEFLLVAGLLQRSLIDFRATLGTRLVLGPKKIKYMVTVKHGTI